MGVEGMTAYQVPLTTPPTTPFQKELTSWIRKPGASLELSAERLAEAMDSGRVKTSGWGRMDGWWECRRAEFSYLGVAATCERNVQTMLLLLLPRLRIIRISVL